jgi:type II restriction enzyme
MHLNFNIDLAAAYKSPSQIARVLSEDWVLREIYCPNCGESVQGYKNNTPVADFCCKTCFEDFELKAKVGKIGNKVPAGAYSKMIERLKSPQKPNFFFLGYRNKLWTATDFFVVPKHFFVPSIIEKRMALIATAKRAGWIGSNILFSRIPNAGKIFYIQNGIEIEKTEVLNKWQKTLFLKQIQNVESKGWILDIIRCIESLDKQEFTLHDMYQFEHSLSLLHTQNKNIKPKIRQQLQILRDRKFLLFSGDGNYRLR